MKRQIRKFEIPFIEEGWSKIIIHDEFKNHVRNLVNEIAYMGDFDQKNPHHTMDLYKHCLHTKKLMKEKGYENPWLSGAMMKYMDYTPRTLEEIRTGWILES